MHKVERYEPEQDSEPVIMPTYAARSMDRSIDKHAISRHGLKPRVAANIIRDELMLDGNARLNLATFVTTWMEPEARDLMRETFDKNMIDKDEYPQTAEIEKRCVNIIARLWNAPADGEACGTSTIGSSEAAMLGGMAMKWRWRERRQAAGNDSGAPNLVMGSNVQVCWEKFCRYWDIEPRLVPVEGKRYHLGVDEAIARCDENTIGVVPIMGSTFDGSYEPVKDLNAALDAYQDKTGLDIPIHVDGASGGFVAPFLQPDLEWDFRVPRVKSINVSGHKYGLVYPGVGWVIWRDWKELPEDLIFRVNYLGGEMPTFAINFSRPGNQVVAQYYNLLRLGFEGYRKVHQTSQDVAHYLSGQIAELGPFELLSDGSDIPVFAWTMKEAKNFSLFDLSDRLRERGWQVPAYTMPENLQDLVVARAVVKEGFSHDMADMLLDDIRRHLKSFAAQPGLKPEPPRPQFRH